MVHRYKNNGYNIVLDVNSGAVHIVDEIVYDLIPLMEHHMNADDTELAGLLSGRYPVAEVHEAAAEIRELKDEGALFTPDTFEQYVESFTKGKLEHPVVKALCLHIAHDCNLRCKYCFAEEGEYHGRRALMSYEVGCRALDFLIGHSGGRRNLEVDFFGGEPTMNFEVVKQLVAYGRKREKEAGKSFRFTLTTNGMLLNDEILDFANKEMHNLVLSIDGRKG